MDIHAPMEPVHSWKDVAIHIAIMTVGLFIALMLEGAVEYWHHRHIVAEARANIRTELENNHASAEKDIVYLSQNLKNVASNIQTLQQMRKEGKLHGSLVNTMTFSTLDDAAWRTARDTGALSYMPYGEVQQYSDIYSSQQEVNSKAQSAADGEFRALAPVLTVGSPDKLSADDYTAMLHQNGISLIELCTLKQYIQQLDGQYIQALKLNVPPPKVSSCQNLQ